MGATAMMDRAKWLSVLARAPGAEVQRAMADLPRDGIRWVRPATMGMVMCEGRAGGSGGRFSLGQATVTRATAQRGGVTGVGYVMGHDPERAEGMALADLYLQAGEGALFETLIAPQMAAQNAARTDRARAAAATRVEFFTMARQSGARST